MNFRAIFIIVLAYVNFFAFANTGWSGKIGNDQSLESLIINGVHQIYNSQCKIQNFDFVKELTTSPIIAITRLDSKIDYLGTNAPLYDVNFQIFSEENHSYIGQNFIVEVIYDSLSQVFTIELVDRDSLECVN